MNAALGSANDPGGHAQCDPTFQQLSLYWHWKRETLGSAHP
jgi:hypothetical protein